MLKKSAFSLIEILMVLGIISVVTAMGFSISKRSAENAYNLYWYTAYSALRDATTDAVYTERFIPTDPDFVKYTHHLNSLMRGKDYTSGSAQAKFTARNDTQFIIDNETTYYKITVTIPASQQKKQAKNKSVFVYNLNNQEVYPSSSTSNTAPWINLHNRVDILPFYIPDANGNPVQKYYGFKDAYCRTRGTVTGSDIAIDCTGIPIMNENASIISISPRKAF